MSFVDSNLEDYEIFENQVTYVKNNDKGRESYAFYIKDKSLPTDKFHLKNLVFSKQDSETIYTVQIVSYYLPDGIDKSSKNIIIENIENLDSQTGLPNKNINGKSSSCEPSRSTIEIYHSCTGSEKYPSTLVYANKAVDKMRLEIKNENLINFDVHTMSWKDIVGSWLFELGTFPVNNSAGFGNISTLGFTGIDFTISGNPNDNYMRHLTTHKTNLNGTLSLNSIMDLRKQAITRIKDGNLQTFNGEWVFGTDATIETIKKLDGMQFCLGSYHTDVFISSLGNKKYEITYIVKNKTDWTSGTRGLNDYNGDPTDDSVIDDKPRGAGIHLGGTIGETFGWKETVTVP